jgi:hypothetical protein
LKITTYRPFLNKEDSGIDLVGLAQEQHYSLSRQVRLGNAWGLAFSTTQAPPLGAGGLDRFTYNSKELLTDLELGWNDGVYPDLINSFKGQIYFSFI